MGKKFDIHDYLSAVTVDILLDTAMGVRGGKREKTGFDYAMAVMKYWSSCNIIFFVVQWLIIDDFGGLQIV